MTQMNEQRSSLTIFTAAALGLVIPSMASGRATLQALAGVCLILTVFCAIREQGIIEDFRRTLQSRLAHLVILAFAGMSICLFVSSDPQRSFEAWGRTGVFVIAGVLFWAFLRRQKDRVWICQRALVMGTLVLSVIAVVGFLGFPWPLQLIKMELRPVAPEWPAGTVKAFAAAIACAIPALCLIAWRADGRWRWLSLSAAILCLVVVIVANNKSALAGILAMLVFASLLVAWRRGGRWLIAWLGWAALSSAVILGLVYILPEPAPSTVVWDWIPTWLIDSHRQQIWNFTAQRFLESPWIGHGINVIDRVPGADTILPGYNVQVLPSHPHNWVLEVLAETGLVGFIPVVGALGWFFVTRIRDYLVFGHKEALTQVAIGSVFWASSLFNFSIWSSWWLITFVVLIAIVEASAAHEP